MRAAQANRQAQALAAGLKKLKLKLLAPVEANGVFVALPPKLVRGLEARGWHFYRFIGAHGYRLMCSWATPPDAVERFVADVRAAR